MVDSQSTPARAWDDTRHAHHTVGFFYLIDLAAAAAGGFAGAAMAPDGASRVMNAAYSSIGVIAGAVAGVGVIYVFFLVIAPYRQRNEARRELVALGEPDEYDKVIDQLRTVKFLDVDLSVILQHLGAALALGIESQNIGRVLNKLKNGLGPLHARDILAELRIAGIIDIERRTETDYPQEQIFRSEYLADPSPTERHLEIAHLIEFGTHIVSRLTKR